MKTLAIVNPQSGGGWAKKNRDALFSAIQSRLTNIEIVETSGVKDAQKIARELDTNVWTTVIAAGGDGTIHEVVNGLIEGRGEFPLQTRLGILSLGRGCDFVRTARIPRELDKALNVIKDAHVKRVDVGRVQFMRSGEPPARKYFLNSCSFGLGGSIAAAVQQGSQSFPSFLAYPTALVKGFLAYKPSNLKLVVDGKVFHNGPSLNVFVCNGRYSGQGMYWAPQAQLDDGLVDVVVVKEMPLGRFVKAFPRIYNGTIQQVEGISSISGHKVEVTSSDSQSLELDGEAVQAESVQIELLNQVLPLLVP